MSHQSSPEEWPLIATRHVQQRVIDYQDLTRVDHLVRAVLREEVDLAGARAELRRITSTGHDRPRWAVTLGWGVMCAGVGVQLGGDWLVVLLAAVAAMAIDRLQMVIARRRIPAFYQQVAGGGLATLIAVGAAATPLDVDVQLVVTANIVMLLAGIGFMGALQDALTGFYITAGARLTEALLATAGIIAGVSGGLGSPRSSASTSRRSTSAGPASSRSAWPRSVPPWPPRRSRSRRTRPSGCWSRWRWSPASRCRSRCRSSEPGHRPHLVGGAGGAVRRPGRLRASPAGCGSRR